MLGNAIKPENSKKSQDFTENPGKLWEMPKFWEKTWKIKKTPENPGKSQKFLGKSWRNPGKCWKTFENRGKSNKNLGKNPEKSWEILEKSNENLEKKNPRKILGNLGKSLEVPENHGKPRKTQENTRKILKKPGKITENLGKSQKIT